MTAPASNPASRSAARLRKNRMWFFGAYQPALTTNERTVDTSTAANPAATAANDDQKLHGALHHRRTSPRS